MKSNQPIPASTLAKATKAEPIDGWLLIYAREDGVSLQGIYTKGPVMMVGIGGTRDNLADWVRNLYPEAEALAFASVVRGFVHELQPTTLVFAGHSQGGAHAEILAEALGGVAVTFGGLPTGRPATHYLMRSDPMAWVPWWLLGIPRRGRKIKLGAPGFSGRSHLIEAYIEALVAYEHKHP